MSTAYSGEITGFDAATLPRVVSAGLSRERPGSTFQEYTLGCLEINYHSGGSCDVRLNGAAGRISAGNVYIYQPGDRFGADMKRERQEMICRWVKFIWPGWSAAGAAGFKLPRQLTLVPEGQRAVQREFDGLLDAYAAGHPGWELAAASRLLALIGVLIREAARAGQSSGNPALDRRLAAACAFIEQNFARRLKVSDIARSAQLGEDYFARVFRKRLGISPLQYLIGVRIQEGRRVLAQRPGATIREASRLAGFDDARHFARSFRKQFGVTPDQFRRELASPFQPRAL